MQKKKIVLFGVGALSKLLTNSIRENIEIVAYIVDDDSGDINGVPIVATRQVTSLEFDYVVVAFGNVIKGIEVLVNAGVPKNKIVGYANSGQTYEYNTMQQEMENLYHELVQDEKIPELFNLPQKHYYLCGMNIRENQEIISQDFVREQTLSFLADEIYRKSVKGAVAEIGVSSGIFAAKINSLFPDRVCYLFDTYEGLPENDKKKALALGWGERQYARVEHGTNIDKVLNAMPYSEKCVIKKGIFPDTFDITDPLAFVSLDIDIFETVLSGLEKVYPLLSKGGYMMVHDFHNLSFEESRDAIIAFCDKYDAVYVPIPDCGGSVVIGK